MISVFIFPLILIFEFSLFILIPFILSLINEPYMLEKKEVLRNIKIFVFSFITLILILWGLSQFIFFGATLKFSFLALLPIFGIFLIVYCSKLDSFCPFYILFIQILLCLFFVCIGNCKVIREEEFLSRSDIIYYEKTSISEVTGNASKLTTNFIDIHRFSDSKTHSEKTFNSNDYTIEIYHDVDDNNEYYEIYNQKLWQQLHGLGCQYDISYGKHLVKFHVK
ncbi:MAG: hypothetical protein HFJ42_04245 [Clostridia bacterium]|nr:hypothetical protein [Clostridia bacterium]